MPLTVDPTLVKQIGTSESVLTKDLLAGATIDAGQTVYIDTSVSPNVWKLAQSDGTIEEAGKNGIGIALNKAYVNQPLTVIRSGGTIYLGVSPLEGEIYTASPTPGGIDKIGDIPSTNTNYMSVLGYGNNATNLVLDFIITGFKRH
jgi:hypothetical protein